MSRIFKRPMFRKGGNVMEGVMTGIQDRSNYAEQGVVNSKLEQQKKDLSESMDLAGYLTKQMGTPDYLAQALISGGLRAVGGAGAGKGKAAELATAFAPAVEQAFQGQQKARDTKLGLGLELFKGMGGKDLADIRLADEIARIESIPEKDRSPSERRRLQILTSKYAEGNAYLKGASPENRIRAREDAYLKNPPTYAIGMNSDELQNLAIFEQTSFDKKLAGEKSLDAIMGVYPLSTDLKIQDDTVQFVPTNQNKQLYNQLVSGGRYFIPSTGQIAVFDKNTNIFTPIE
jgi:hypothetical protein